MILPESLITETLTCGKNKLAQATREVFVRKKYAMLLQPHYYNMQGLQLLTYALSRMDTLQGATAVLSEEQASAIVRRIKQYPYPCTSPTVKGVAAPVVNLSPVVEAGGPINTTGNTAQLSGTATDPDGTIVSVIWIQISGPNTAVITNPGTLTPTLSGLIGGTYVFQLTARDNKGAESSDQCLVQYIASTNDIIYYGVADTEVSPIVAGIVTSGVTATVNGALDFAVNWAGSFTPSFKLYWLIVPKRTADHTKNRVFLPSTGFEAVIAADQFWKPPTDVIVNGITHQLYFTAWKSYIDYVQEFRKR